MQNAHFRLVAAHTARDMPRTAAAFSPMTHGLLGPCGLQASERVITARRPPIGNRGQNLIQKALQFAKFVVDGPCAKPETYAGRDGAGPWPARLRDRPFPQGRPTARWCLWGLFAWRPQWCGRCAPPAALRQGWRCKSLSPGRSLRDLPNARPKAAQNLIYVLDIQRLSPN